jgi:DeoR family glycerol-3-phosphate regulon repressor
MSIRNSQISDRQSEILLAVRARGKVLVEDLSSSFAVTPQTIRRDLNELCQRGLVARIHGGAMPATGVANLAYEERRTQFASEKALIGAAAASCIPENSSLLINIGTTTEQVARALYSHRDLVIITNNINVISILNGSPSKELILTGGVVRQSDGAIVGEAAVEFIRQFRVDCAVIGASALDEDGAVLDYDYREVLVARAIIENARRTILVADHQKFARSAPVRICDLEQIDMFITDRQPPQRFLETCERFGTEVVVAKAGDSPNLENEHG